MSKIRTQIYKQWLHYDLFKLVGLPLIFNVAHILLHWMTIYFLYLLYYSKHIQSVFKHWFISNQFNNNYARNNQLSNTKIKKIYLVTINLLDFFQLVIKVSLICSFMALLLVKSQSFSKVVVFYIAVVIVHQWICTFAIHLQVATLNVRLHKPSQRALYLTAKNLHLKISNTNFKIKLHNYITFFHVPSNRRYGITYWGGSLITLNTFTELAWLELWALIDRN
ncbi:hypothetical protein TYRP_019276 [Tyrophagus putrescentiae]|nr:hypothetical protein TYRP_019276 [Tyrophagus putrescentiae]